MTPFLAAVTPPSALPEPAWWFAFVADRLLVTLEETKATVPCVFELAELGLKPERHHYLGTLNGRPCFAADLTEETVPPAGMSFQGLRRLWQKLDDDLFLVAGRAVQIVNWDRHHQYCGRCGSATQDKPGERAKQCPHCGQTNFPRISPAIIVAVTKGDKILLGRNHRSPQGFFSVIAGFVEPGETLEECVQREVLEETGILVENIRYFGSQPWPFPHSLMIGFTATYQGGEIAPDNDEIAEAHWFTAENLPLIPGKISISRQLIDWFVAQQSA
ncbi:MAG: NAD(+) diphosphatase [Anaerolineae bacterium]|nr:NAD(+) diphosphatase [Anaerolineae bacterium]